MVRLFLAIVLLVETMGCDKCQLDALLQIWGNIVQHFAQQPPNSPAQQRLMQHSGAGAHYINILQERIAGHNAKEWLRDRGLAAIVLQHPDFDVLCCALAVPCFALMCCAGPCRPRAWAPEASSFDFWVPDTSTCVEQPRYGDEKQMSFSYLGKTKSQVGKEQRRIGFEVTQRLHYISGQARKA